MSWLSADLFHVIGGDGTGSQIRFALPQVVYEASSGPVHSH